MTTLVIYNLGSATPISASLDIPKVIEIAKQNAIEVIHHGYGFRMVLNLFDGLSITWAFSAMRPVPVVVSLATVCLKVMELYECRRRWGVCGISHGARKIVGNYLTYYKNARPSTCRLRRIPFCRAFYLIQEERESSRHQTNLAITHHPSQ